MFAKRSVSERIIYAFVFILFSAFALSYLYIFFWGIMSSLKDHASIILEPFALPEKPNWRVFYEVFKEFSVNDSGFWEMTFNSLWFSVIPAAGGILFCAMLSYVTTKYKFFGARAYYFVSFVVMLLPIYSSGGAAYKLIYNLGLTNSYAYVLLGFGGLGATYMFFAAFYRNLSWSYAEAAFIDGANDWQVFFVIMLPQSITMLGALFLITWMGAWNSYDAQLLYLPEIPTLSVGIYLYDFMMRYNPAKGRSYLIAACMISCLPTLVMFICFNNVMMSNVSLGGIKE